MERSFFFVNYLSFFLSGALLHNFLSLNEVAKAFPLLVFLTQLHSPPQIVAWIVVPPLILVNNSTIRLLPCIGKDWNLIKILVLLSFHHPFEWLSNISYRVNILNLSSP